MLTEKKIQKVLDRILQNIDVNVDVADMISTVVASSDNRHIGNSYPFIKTIAYQKDCTIFTNGGKTYKRISAGKNLFYFLVMDGTNAITRNYCILIVSLMEMYLRVSHQKMDREDALREIILGQVPDSEFEELLRDYKIMADVKRCTFVIKSMTMQADNIYRILIKAFPKDEGDIVVSLDSHTVLLLKSISDEMECDDLFQLGAAIEETILNETSIKAVIGIGGCKPNIYGIRESYLEAVRAIEVGTIHDISTRIYLYDILLLERFIYEIPIEISKKFYNTMFRDEFKKVFNDEMILTVEKFFENSLNLSETARQLYIHRNTLVYRLDKIQKVTGLDLRNFHDAVTFRIMLMLERHVQECCR